MDMDCKLTDVVPTDVTVTLPVKKSTNVGCDKLTNFNVYFTKSGFKIVM